MNRLATATLAAVVVILVTALPAGAASGPFADYRQAAQAQYGGNPPGPPPDRPPQDPGPGNPPGRPPDRPPGSGQGTAPGSDTGAQGQGQGQGQGADTGAGATERTLNLLFLSPVDPVIVSGVTAVLTTMGEPQPRVLSLTEPLNLPALAAAASGTRFSRLSESRLALVRALGRRVGTELVKPSPFFDRVGALLFTVDPGLEAQKFVVFARSGGKLATRAATRVRNAFEIGLARGVRSARIEVDGAKRKVPTAGVETTQTTPSQIKWYKARKIPSVDNIDTLNGQKALLAILRDKAKGHYGVKKTAQRLLPKSVKVDPASAAIVDARGESETGFGTGLAITLLALMGAWTTLAVVSRVRRSRPPTR